MSGKEEKSKVTVWILLLFFSGSSWLHWFLLSRFLLLNAGQEAVWVRTQCCLSFDCSVVAAPCLFLV